MIKNIGAAVAVAIAAVVLVGCGGGTAAPTVTVTQGQTSPTTLPAPVESPEDQYINALRSMNNKYIASASDADLIDVGYSVCEAFDSGITVDELSSALVQEFSGQGITDTSFYEAIGMIIGASALVLCPQYSSLV